MNDESVKSSLQPDHIVFHEYSANEMKEILEMRADEGLYKYSKEAISLLSAMLKLLKFWEGIINGAMRT